MSSDFDKLKVYQSKLSAEDFKRIAEYVENTLGIKMPEHKILMVQNRLYKRLIELEIPTFEEYVRFIFSPVGRAELDELANVLTTNKSEFFRESAHFDVLRQIVKDFNGVVKIWSAACATGEEVYSIAMVLNDLGVKYRILGSDISDKALEVARQGVYSASQTANVPPGYLSRYFIETEREGRKYYRIRKELFPDITFRKINLISPGYDVDLQDIIFLRNVLIYFNSKVQNSVLRKILKYLKSGGYLFLGHSESILDFSIPVSRVAPSVYQKK